jgi:5'-3' exonuclease
MEYKGSPTGIIFGFTRQLVSLMENFEPNQLAFCWDSREYKRRELYPGYKVKDKQTEEEEASRVLIYSQFDVIRTVLLPMLGFENIFRVNGYESDDLIAKYVIDRKCSPEGTIVITRDHDLYQLLDYCSLHCITKAQTTSREIFLRHYGILPDTWSMVKAIAGCSGDKVPGVFGIGEKKAIAFLKGELNPGKMLLKIHESKDLIYKSLQLVKLPYPGTPLMKLKKNNLNLDRFKCACTTYGMESLMDKNTLPRWGRIISRIE